MTKEKTFIRGNARLERMMQDPKTAARVAEIRADMLLSTLRGYLAAAGAQNPRILVTVGGVEMEMAI
jgi:hypothetical protein